MSDDAITPGQMVACPTCGAENRQSARFCRQCGGKLGGATAAPTPPPVPPVVAPSTQAVAPPPSADAGPSTTAAAASARRSLNVPPQLKRPVVFIPAVVIAVALIGALVFFLVGPLDLLSPSVHEFANRDVQITASTDPASVVLGHLQRGDAIVGKWVKAPGGQARWLKVKWPVQGSGYIWGRDLSDRLRPDITLATSNVATAVVSSVVYAEADARSPVIDDLAAGETATPIGETKDGWAEIALNAGGVGYVKAVAFQGVGGSPAVANVDASPVQIAALAGITHYSCSFSSDQSKNPPDGGTGPLSFYLDEGRTCLNHRYAYAPDDVGGLKRVMLSDKDRRASLLYFMPDRKSFYRTDFVLSPDDYAKLLRSSVALDSATCSPPADPTALSALRAVLKKAMPSLDAQTPSVLSQRRVWQCTAEK
jgi:hypothetical protein